MRSTLRRNIAVLAIVLVAGLPAGRALCEVLCAPGGHAIAGDVARAGEHHAESCHESAHPITPALAAVPTHGCSDHTPIEIGVWLKAGRFESSARPLEAYLPAAAFEQAAVPARVRVPSPRPPDSRSYPLVSLASVVLRI